MILSLIKISPELGESSPLHSLSNVVFPAPEGPTKVVILPSRKDSVIFFKI
jgi:hypothetical protein